MKNSWIVLLLVLATATLSPQDYKPALPGYMFHFPQDYFSHPDYQTEWWYYTGNLKSSDGHRFGFELTFFRQGVSRESRSGPWFVHDLWMAHLALSDINGQHFYHEERLNRAGPGIAGVDASTGLIWNGNWQAHIAERDEELRGIGNNFNIKLNLVSTKPPVLQGQNGVSQKAEGAGRASHYFSLTRLVTSGTIELDGKTYQVEGSSWMDHEFFTGLMSASETGWDWLSVQLSDGTELMLYRLRHKEGAVDPYSSGSYVDATGKTTFLSVNDFTMTPATETWTGPLTKESYPMHWHISVPRFKIAFDVTTPLKNQLLTNKVGPSYWEGVIDINGVRDNVPLRGSGYLEMTGYAHVDEPIIPR
jgi:predicted secreted hydrolase